MGSWSFKMQDKIFAARVYGEVQPPPPPPPHPHWFLGQNLCNSGENLTQNCNGILLIGGGGRGGGAVLPLSRHHCLYILKCIKVLFGRTPELVDVREISTMLETIF